MKGCDFMVKAIIASIKLSTTSDLEFSYKEKEMIKLCEADDIEVVSSIYQNADSINPTTFLGKGKLEEIKKDMELYEVDVCIFNTELTLHQLNNISSILGEDKTVYDRTTLILNIFLTRAKTKEAFLQVKIAQLKYFLPRLVGLRSYLSRSGGSASGAGSATRGAGETKLELDKRYIKAQINKYEKELIQIKKQRQTARKARQNYDLPSVALVGYTNAGKSTIMNYFINNFKARGEKLEVLQKDMLFATLGTTTRMIKLKNNHKFLLTDTVGFVSDLPHHLVESFKSTLEEIKEASLLIHVVDASSPHMENELTTTISVLESLEIKNIPTIIIYNKMDLVKIPLFKESDNTLLLSIKDESSYEKLAQAINNILFSNCINTNILIPFEKSAIFDFIKNNEDIINIEFLDSGILINANILEKDLYKYQDYIKK